MDKDIKDVYGSVNTEKVASELGITEKKVSVIMNAGFDVPTKTFEEWRVVHDIAGKEYDYSAKEEALSELFALARTFEEWRVVHDIAGNDSDGTRRETIPKLFALARTFEEWVYVFSAAERYLQYKETGKFAFAKMFSLAKTAEEWRRVYSVDAKCWHY